MNRMRKTIAVTALALLVTLALPVIASAAYEQGSTANWQNGQPWSGYWWPMLDRSGSDLNLYDENGPLDKYDKYARATGRAGNAKSYEKANHFTADSTKGWYGHCHAWSAASILSPRPRYNFSKGGVTFGLNDTRGMVTELYFDPTLYWLSGRRSETNDENSAAYQDIAPAWMDYLLRYYIGKYRYPFIMDISAGSEVWNFPAFAYRRQSTSNADGSESVTTTVYYASPKANQNDIAYFSKVYTYRLKAGELGTWTGDSHKEHPDFAWVPTGKKASPHVNEAIVEEILGQNV